MEDKEKIEKAQEKLEKYSKYAKHFDEDIAYRLLKKLRKETKNSHPWIASAAGKLVEVLGHLLSTYKNPDTPMKYKALIVAAVGYVVLPIDAIPDLIPIVGWTDDLAVASFTMAAMTAVVMAYSDFSLEELDRAINEEERSGS